MTTPPLARTSHEAHLHVELTPCSCGGRRFGITSTVLDLPGGVPGRRYTRTCHACGIQQDFIYRLPEEPLNTPGFAYGGNQPSELLDAAQWLWVADWYARAVPPDPARLPPDEQRVARGRLTAAIAAIDEIMKFVPPGADRVPPEAVWTPMGADVRAAEGDRLTAGRLGAVRSAYAEILNGFPGPADAAAALAAYREVLDRLAGDDRALHRVERAFAVWARKYSIDDRDWSEDGWAGDDRRSPTAEQAWEFVRTARAIASAQTV